MSRFAPSSAAKAARLWVRAAFFSLCLVLSFPAIAQTKSPTPKTTNSAAATESTNTPVMALQVVDSESGKAISDVKVRAWVRAEPTDSNGVCHLPIPKPASENFSYKITLSKPGYVGEFMTWSKAQGDKFTDIPTNFLAKMEKAVSIGGVVKSESGEPVQGARIVFSGTPGVTWDDRVRSVVGPNYHVERTDAGGKWHFDEAPAAVEQLILRVTQPDYFTTFFAADGAVAGGLTVTFLPKADFLATNATMVLGHGLVLTGHVVDFAGKPVADATVTRNYEWRNPAAQLLTDTNGEFKIPNLKPGDIYLTIQSPGLAGQTKFLTLSNGMPDLKVEMARGNVFKGRVVDAAGKPVEGVAVQMDRRDRGPIEFEWSTTTDADGKFSWDSAPNDSHPYAFMAGGFHPRTEPSLAADGTEHVITMHRATDGDQTYIDGLVTDETTKQPLTDFTVYIKQYNGRAVSHSRQSFTNSDGRYSITIPSTANGYVVTLGAKGHRVVTSHLQDVGDGDVRLDFPMTADPKSSGELFAATGKFALNDFKGQVTWTNQQAVLENVISPPNLPANPNVDEQTQLQEFLMTDEGRRWQDSRHKYDVEIDATGGFKVDELPEGPYELSIKLHDGADARGETIAELSVNLEVPGAANKTNGIVDLGEFPLAPKKALHLGDAAPLFETKTLDGEPLRLADYRGKIVLLDFWATWCGPCVAETPFLKATYKKFGGMSSFAIISLSLDANPAAPKAFAAKEGVKWTQGFLGEWSKSKVPALYGVEGIPAIFLIGPDGKILAKELRGDAIKSAVGAAIGSD